MKGAAVLFHLTLKPWERSTQSTPAMLGHVWYGAQEPQHVCRLASSLAAFGRIRAMTPERAKKEAAATARKATILEITGLLYEQPAQSGGDKGLIGDILPKLQATLFLSAHLASESRTT
jgi:hypothetical protein